VAQKLLISITEKIVALWGAPSRYLKARITHSENGNDEVTMSKRLIRNFLKLALSALWLGPVGAVAMPILNVDSSGQLIGASNVDVSGSFYNVEFVQGDCFGVFNNCDEGAFTFTTQESASAASAALLAQVFTDTAINGLGDFDSLPQLTAGCTSTTPCGATTPYLIAFGVRFITASNGSAEYLDRLLTGETSFAAPKLWAVWTATDPMDVPEPSTISLLALGLAGLGYRRKRRQPLCSSQRLCRHAKV